MKFLYRVLYISEEDYDKSQIAAAYHRSIGGIADSAGINTPRKNLELSLHDIPEAENTIQIMKEVGIDISGIKPRLLTLTLFGTFDKIVCMAEKNFCPNYLINNRRAIFWNIEDAKGKDLETTRRIKNEIKQKIDEEFKQW